MPTYRVNQPPPDEAQPETQPVWRCPICGTPERAFARTYYGMYECYGCYNRYRHCDGTSHNVELAQPVGQNTSVCVECLRANGYFMCTLCQAFGRAAFHTVEDELICRHCATTRAQCAECDRYAAEGEYLETGLDVVCIPCNTRNFERLQTSTIDTCPCNSCTRARRSRPQMAVNSDVAYLHSWDYRPVLEFHGKGPMFLGMELELETGRGCLDACFDVVRRHLTSDVAYLKSDGSIECGFELVTHPMTFEWARDNFPWEMISDLESQGAYTHDRVGMHVHVSRRGFTSPAHVYKWMKFIYRNSAQVMRIARRQSSDWAAFSDSDRHNIKYYCKGSHGDGRYRAINTLNPETFEIRVFRSSTYVQEIQAALAFSEASTRYTHELSASEIIRGGWEWNRFYDWVAKNPLYTPLKNEMEVQGCVS